MSQHEQQQITLARHEATRRSVNHIAIQYKSDDTSWGVWADCWRALVALTVDTARSLAPSLPQPRIQTSACSACRCACEAARGVKMFCWAGKFLTLPRQSCSWEFAFGGGGEICCVEILLFYIGRLHFPVFVQVSQLFLTRFVIKMSEPRSFCHFSEAFHSKMPHRIRTRVVRLDSQSAVVIHRPTATKG